MGKVLSIDYGAKRCGVAITDELQLIASGLAAVETREIISYLSDYCQREPVERIVIGLPRRLSGELSEVETLIQSFIVDLQKIVKHIPITRVDERFTSKIAKYAMSLSGMKKKQRQDKGVLDRMSATLILQSYLDSKK